MLCMDHSAMEPPLSCLKALQCTLTQVRKWWEKVWLEVAKEVQRPVQRDLPAQER